MKLTEWFGPDVKPTIPGVYETKDIGEKYSFGAQYWKGDHWGVWCVNHESAARNAYLGRSYFQNVEWRGLAEKPE